MKVLETETENKKALSKLFLNEFVRSRHDIFKAAKSLNIKSIYLFLLFLTFNSRQFEKVYI